MFKMASTAMALALTAAASLPASAAPVVNPLALKNAAPTLTDNVYWRGGGWRGGGWGWGVGPGFALGLGLGALGAAPYYGYGGPYYGSYAYGGDCVMRRRPVINRWGHRVWRWVRVCY